MPWLADGPTFVPPSADDFKLPPIFGDVTKPMVLAVLSIVIISVFFLLAARKMKIVPTKFQFLAEGFYDFSRNGIAREQIGGNNFRPFIPLILALFSFTLVNNLFGIIPILQFPTFSHFG